MKINKLKSLLIAIPCAAILLQSEVQSMEDISLTPDKIQAGGSQNLVKLIQKSKEKIEFQFVDTMNSPLYYEGKISPYYDISTLQNHLNLTKKIYDDIIKQIQEDACVRIKTDPNIQYLEERDFIRNLLNNYLDDAILTANSISENKLQKFNHYINFSYYMNLCNSVYTDFYTRNFLVQQKSLIIDKKLNKIIYCKEEIERLQSLMRKIQTSYSSLIDQPVIYEINPSKYERSEQTLYIGREAQLPKIKEDFRSNLGQINNFLKLISKEPINDERLVEKLDFQSVILKLNDIQLGINTNYFWNFEEKQKNPESFIQEISGKINSDNIRILPIPKFLDIKNQEHQLTAKAVIASSFLTKSQLSTNQDITILDVGFRNQERLGNLWNSFVTRAMKPTNNPLACFQNMGEVDYVAYLEQDTTPAEKDKLVIVFSGSNSQIDWGINLTIGHDAFLGLSVHKGIGWLFNTTINTSHNLLMGRIQDYYRCHKRPKKLEIITTGHSLGAGLAELAAYYYKIVQIKEFKDIIDIDKISVKTFTFAAPAIVDKNSKKMIEDALGIDNIYSVWVDGDLVVNWSEEQHVQGGVHIGMSFPLYNIHNIRLDFLDWWGPHGASRYISHLHTYTTLYATLINKLNEYIKTEHLDIYKRNREKLLQIIETFKKENLPDTLDLHQGLAEHIMKYPLSKKRLRGDDDKFPTESPKKRKINSDNIKKLLEGAWLDKSIDHYRSLKNKNITLGELNNVLIGMDELYKVDNMFDKASTFGFLSILPSWISPTQKLSNISSTSYKMSNQEIAEWWSELQINLVKSEACPGDCRIAPVGWIEEKKVNLLKNDIACMIRLYVDNYKEERDSFKELY